jgi:hypothetical protein
MACAKERGTVGTVVDIWEQRDLYARHYIYRIETETHVYYFLGNFPQTFQQGDTPTLTLDKDHQHARVVAGRGMKTTLLLIGDLEQSTLTPNK